jgi:hypothetical protein
MPRNAITMTPECMGRTGIHFTREHFGSKKALRSSGQRFSWQAKGAAFPWCQKGGGPWYVVSLREFLLSLRHPDYSAAIGTFPVPFPGGVRMATRFKSRTRRSRRYLTIVKPSGSLHPRVQKVGPEHFGIVAVDCAKARSKWMLADFYGRILIPPTVVEHNKQGFDSAFAEISRAMESHSLVLQRYA